RRALHFSAQGDFVKAVAVIPARYASQRFPGKPLARIAGKPMIQHVYERASRVREFARVLVATDDARIADCVRGFGGECVMTSPVLASGTDRMFAALRGMSYDWAFNVQGDEPLMDPAVLRALLRRAARAQTPCIITAADTLLRPQDFNNPNIVKVAISGAGQALYFSRAPIPYLGRVGRGEPHAEPLRHIGLYLFHKKALAAFVRTPPSLLERTEKLEQLRAYEAGIPIEVVRTRYASINVDVPADIRRVEAALKRKGA
ncbi:MAG: 3-deoxy-manno-octulosonate cytidylyltransferase, partial [Fibrobacterota bacterium]